MARRLALLFALLLSAVGLSLSQQRPRPNTDAAPDENSIIRAGINLVDLLVSVRDKKGAIASDLKQTDFRILEDGKEQEIRNFTRETDLPLTIGMVVDVSGSVKGEIPDEQVAARQFFNQVLRPQDQAFIISFAMQAELLQDTTSSIGKLQNGLDDLGGGRPSKQRYFVSPSYWQMPFPGGGQFPGGGRRGPYPGGGPGTPPISGPNRRGGNGNKGTVLYDAVFLASDEVLKPLSGRKAIILITDGEDQGSITSLSEAVETTLKADTIVYSIFVKPDSAVNSEDVLQRLSGETGGRVFTLQKRNLDKIFKEIEEELRSQYSISYVSSNQAEDGAYRRIDVQMRDKSYTARTRKGYFAAVSTY